MKNSRADLILNALITQPSIAAAAAALEISEKTIYNYLDKPDFKRRYDAARAQLVADATAHIQGRLTAAIDIISSIMENEDIAPQVRLNAAKAILENAIKFNEHNELIQRLEALESRLNS